MVFCLAQLRFQLAQYDEALPLYFEAVQARRTRVQSALTRSSAPTYTSVYEALDLDEDPTKSCCCPPLCIVGAQVQCSQWTRAFCRDWVFFCFPFLLQCHSLAARDGRVDGETLDVAAALSEMALIYEHKGDYKRYGSRRSLARFLSLFFF